MNLDKEQVKQAAKKRLGEIQKEKLDAALDFVEQAMIDGECECEDGECECDDEVEA